MGKSICLSTGISYSTKNGLVYRATNNNAHRWSGVSLSMECNVVDLQVMSTFYCAVWGGLIWKLRYNEAG